MDEGISVAQADIMSPSTPSRRSLSDNVYLLAGLLGDVLRGSGGERAFVQNQHGHVVFRFDSAARGSSSSSATSPKTSPALMVPISSC